MATKLTLPVEKNFSLPHAVCSYGFFMLAPNRYEPAERALHRPLRDSAGRMVRTRTTQPGGGPLLSIECDRKLPAAEGKLIKAQVARMLRLNEDFSHWRKLHRAAARARFDRMFRSPTLFEDIIKTMTGCNVAWGNTITMNRLLVEHPGAGADFPTAAELAEWEPEKLQPLCKVGYRAQWIIRLARDVASGRLKLEELEAPELSTDELFARLRGIFGVGTYAANNILKDMGRYDRLAVDSETVRHFHQRHGVEGDLKRVTQKAERHYARYAPWQYLAYWFELWGAYETKYGKAHGWSERTQARVTKSS